jgi:diguanylate cyclase (GGDEF)-like protein/PAS domain S-box-containing protein
MIMTSLLELHMLNTTTVFESFPLLIGFSINSLNTPIGWFVGIIVILSVAIFIFHQLWNRHFREGAERFKILFNSTDIGMLIHDKGVILDCNQVICEITGYSKEELLKLSGFSLITSDSQEIAKEKLKNNEEGFYELTGLRKNGEPYPLKLKVRSIPYNGKKVRMVQFNDLTELKEQKNLVEIEKTRYQMLVKEMPLGVAYHELIIDENGHPKDYRFLDINESYEFLTGLKANDMVGKTLLETIPNVERSWIHRFGEVALSGQSVRFEDFSEPLNKTFDVTAFSPEPMHFAVIVDDITEKKNRENEITTVSKHDFLTGLPNRRYCDEMLRLMNREEHFPLLISLCDMDGLKIVNDAYGHPVGDTAIQTVANAIKSNIRPQDFAARIGGDEFLIMCPNSTEADYQVIRNKINQTLKVSQLQDIPISISYGNSIKTSAEESMDKILINAENDMYAQKVLHGQSSRNEAIMTLFNSLIEKYEEEREHSDQVRKYCRHIGYQLKLSSDEIRELELAGMMHDIGKITIPDSILHKPDVLAPHEWEVMKRHTVNGYQILRSADKYSRLAEYALTHHERWDGKGYPNGLKEEEIPLFSRIISVCDSYEAMTSDRVYRCALSVEEARKELLRCAGTQFDPRIVDVFVHEVLKKL